jgi:hypothetical protein
LSRSQPLLHAEPLVLDGEVRGILGELGEDGCDACGIREVNKGESLGGVQVHSHNRSHGVEDACQLRVRYASLGELLHEHRYRLLSFAFRELFGFACSVYD